MLEHFIEVPDLQIQLIEYSKSAVTLPIYMILIQVLPKNRSDPLGLFRIPVPYTEKRFNNKMHGVVMNRNYSAMARKIRKASIYTRKQIISKLEIDSTTFDNWRKKGLSPIDKDSRPQLYRGSDLKNFLKGLAQKRKHKCGPGEIFCVVCQKPVSVELESISIEEGKKKLTPEHESRVINGTGKCSHKVRRFSSSKDAEKFLNHYRDSGCIEKIITDLKMTHYIGQIQNLIPRRKNEANT